ncbi:MFS transporter [Pseudomonas gingeri NCPPB 3146 = LMG 5327]|uniref:MFS transporter n=2 Tax=Pseudomonas gingeri TaxID=117681 RepID=A0A7Y7Y5U3_9PSED|nr:MULTISPECIES: MFS transporter [Pseudomonas]NVZ27891.1 MFS transporter [Pseudomonas gingeri]NWC17708.1 MFS transporter [Pseudomonas gingeri]NWE48286.1 MFS transporter [Pseudomonas gingeri]PNQ93667.1 MFS transporter [Pseudomonas gingeri NCPPB 3146 = LMG 5327]BBP76318.1 multidrug resistance protein [Pseudomonas sp. Ost2]
MLAVLRRYPTSVNLLLASSLILTLGRAITLPYLVIFLSSQFSLGISEIGLVVGIALVAGSLLSVYGGYLTDKGSSFHLILGFTALFVLGFIGMCMTHRLWLFFIFLVLFNFAYSVIDVVVKATLGRVLPEAEQASVFSVRYTLINIGYAVGPFIGAGLAHLDMRLPFVVSALLGVVSLLTYYNFGDRQLSPVDRARAPVSFIGVGRILLRDKRLVCFTLGGLLSAVVFGQFTAYLSQFLVTTGTPEFAYSIISSVVAVNAVVVICLQFVVGKRISQQHLNLWLTAGFSLFLLGVTGFALSSTVLHWSLAMAVFTLGEIIVFPAEYMFIDRIAPQHLRGMYYGAQNLSTLGGALGPVLCGFALAWWAPHFMFYMLAGFIIAGGCFYLIGAAYARQHDASEASRRQG